MLVERPQSLAKCSTAHCIQTHRKGYEDCAKLSPASLPVPPNTAVTLSQCDRHGSSISKHQRGILVVVYRVHAVCDFCDLYAAQAYLRMPMILSQNSCHHAGQVMIFSCMHTTPQPSTGAAVVVGSGALAAGAAGISGERQSQWALIYRIQSTLKKVTPTLDAGSS